MITINSLLEAGVDPDAFLVLASDAEGNEFKPASGSISNAYWDDEDSCLVDEEDVEDTESFDKVVVLWPE